MNGGLVSQAWDDRGADQNGRIQLPGKRGMAGDLR